MKITQRSSASQNKEAAGATALTLQSHIGLSRRRSGHGERWVVRGPTATRVHDQSDLPADGIRYEVRVPLDAAAHQRPCHDGPVLAHVRAILSWNTPVPPGDPNYVPVWGNRQEAEIQIEPGETVTGGKVVPISASTPTPTGITRIRITAPRTSSKATCSGSGSRTSARTPSRSRSGSTSRRTATPRTTSTAIRCTGSSVHRPVNRWCITRGVCLEITY